MSRTVQSRLRFAAVARLVLSVPRREEGDPSVWINHSDVHTSARWSYTVGGPCVFVVGVRRLHGTDWYYGHSDPEGVSHRYRIDCLDGLAAVVRGAIDCLWVHEGRVD